MFSYGSMDTTNHVERHWKWIKNSLLMGKVNRSLRDLVVAIIETAKDVIRCRTNFLAIALQMKAIFNF